MAEAIPSGMPQDDLAREIDRLLKTLPDAEPILRDPPTPPPPRRSQQLVRPRAVARGPRTTVRMDIALVWMRVLLAGGMGAALTQWPYPYSCGPSLYLYLAAVGTLMISAGWAGVWSWRERIAPAHATSLIVAFWGVVLAAEQILPRVGYAFDIAQWSCR